MKITHHCRECGEQVVEIDGEDMYCPGHPGAVIESRLDGPNGESPGAAEILAENARLRAAIGEALDYASHRWSEWGERAIGVAEILEKAIFPPDDVV